MKKNSAKRRPGHIVLNIVEHRPFGLSVLKRLSKNPWHVIWMKHHNSGFVLESNYRRNDSAMLPISNDSIFSLVAFNQIAQNFELKGIVELVKKAESAMPSI
jgi:hypothetical protein